MRDEERSEPPLAGSEVETLLGFLNYQRQTFEWKCSNVDAAGLEKTIAASTMSLGGLLKHLAYVEDEWATRRLFGRDRLEPWASVDWDTDPEWEFRTAATQTPDELFGLWRESVRRSQALIDEALAEGGVDQMAKFGWSDGNVPSLRWILVHLIEEYARHNGHADLLREAVDGSTGE